jgi:hypothetical protein
MKKGVAPGQNSSRSVGNVSSIVPLKRSRETNAVQGSILNAMRNA